MILGSIPHGGGSALQPQARLRLKRGQFDSFCSPEIACVVPHAEYGSAIQGINNVLRANMAKWYLLALIPVLFIFIGIYLSLGLRPSQSPGGNVMIGAAFGLIISAVVTFGIYRRRLDAAIIKAKDHLNSLNQDFVNRVMFQIQECTEVHLNTHQGNGAVPRPAVSATSNYELLVYVMNGVPQPMAAPSMTQQMLNAAAPVALAAGVVGGGAMGGMMPQVGMAYNQQQQQGQYY